MASDRLVSRMGPIFARNGGDWVFSRVLAHYLILICMPTIVLPSVNRMVSMPECNMGNWLSVTDTLQYDTCA